MEVATRGDGSSSSLSAYICVKVFLMFGVTGLCTIGGGRGGEEGGEGGNHGVLVVVVIVVL